VSSERLPIESLRPAFDDAFRAGPVVISAPTGSGKSTRVPAWLLAGASPSRPVWVIEPRRVACRALASRVASMEGTRLGGRVGYRVRDDDRTSAETQLVFATPGIALRQLADVRACHAVVVDELHERRLDVDLLLALLRYERAAGLVVMSATFAGDEIAAGPGWHAPARRGPPLFPVRITHVGDRPPDRQELVERVEQALTRAANDPGDVLVFLPGKGEIHAVYERLAQRRDITTLTLHGGLTLDEQARVFEPAQKRKVILCTNVAETSLTVPGVGVVIDSGLVRRTRYHQGRGFLTLMPIADDSAEQRAGRAGRTAPGVCYRLWSQATRLAPATPPEVHRESLVPLVLGAAGAGVSVRALPFLDPPKEHALLQAEAELRALGALDDAGVTDKGRALSSLPLDAHLGRLVVEAQARREAGSTRCPTTWWRWWRRWPWGARSSTGRRASWTWRTAATCARAAATWWRWCAPCARGTRAAMGCTSMALREARQLQERLRQALGWPAREGERHGGPAIDRHAVAQVILAADSRSAYVARHRKHETAWANGGPELDLGRESALRLKQERDGGRRDAAKVDALLVLDTRAIGASARETRLIATCVMPVPVTWLVEAGLGEERLGNVTRERGHITASLERVYAGVVLQSREAEPEGPLAREAIAKLFLEGPPVQGLARRGQAPRERARARGGARRARGSVTRSVCLPPSRCHRSTCSSRSACSSWEWSAWPTSRCCRPRTCCPTHCRPTRASCWPKSSRRE
jgi:ATP-dependent helicase HrpB